MRTATLSLVALLCCSSLALDLLPSSAREGRRMLAASSNRKMTPEGVLDFIPSYVGSAFLGSEPASWPSRCFETVTAQLSAPENGKYELTISTGRHKSGAGISCHDIYAVAFVGSLQFTEVSRAKHNYSVSFKGNYTDAQLFDLNTLGIRLFEFPKGIMVTVEEVIQTVAMFVGYLIGKGVPAWDAALNVQFLKDHMNYVMDKRTIKRVDIPITEVHAGDFVGIMRLDGLDPMIAWGMGAHTAHTCIVLEMEPGVPYVCESNTKSSYWPIEGVQCLKWAEWVDLAEKADYVVVLLPLKPEARAKFNNEAAVQRVKGLLGMPYGIHQFFSGWLDTPEDNYPGALGSRLAQILMAVIEWITQDLLNLGLDGNIFAEDMCKRLNTTGLNTAQVYQEAARQGLSFTDLVTIPSSDNWVFNNEDGHVGPSMDCCVLVQELYKVGGLLGPDSDKIRTSEFTNWDVYSQDFFDTAYKRPQVCIDADPDLGYCQILGSYRMSLDNYGTVKPFAHMRERCPSKSPLYKRPADC